jgi:D-glycero-D-manno-heptose 1,7-bisphosphate phosphatase
MGRGLMTEKDFHEIHENMEKIFEENDIFIDKIYYCPYDHGKEIFDCRKPNLGLAKQAKKELPEIDFKKSVMVGDFISDMQFGKTLGTLTIYLNSPSDDTPELGDLCFKNIFEFDLSINKVISIRSLQKRL